MATSDVKISQGSGKNVATYSFTEDSETKEAQRVALTDSTGAELNDTTNHAVKVTLATALVAEDATNSAFRMEGAGAQFSAVVGFPVVIAGWDGANTIIPTVYIPGDGNSNDESLEVMSRNQAYNGATWDRVRIANKFKSVTATASGNTAAWTPTTGKKFRLMGFLVTIPQNVAISGGGVVVDITFQDSTTDMGLGISTFIPTTAVTTTAGGFSTSWIDLGNGILSAAANNVLNINLSATLTTGKVRVSVAGTEE